MNLFKNFGLLIISTIIITLILELILNIFFPQAKNSSWRVQNEDGVYLNKNFGTAKHEFYGEYEIISVKYNFGKYHNRILLNDEYKSKNNKILVLGDSNIFGWLLEDDQIFLTKLQKEYKNYYFINAAAGGFNDTDMYLYLKKYCKNINPKFILFFIDIDRVVRKQSLSLNINNEIIIKKNEINNFKKFLNKKKIYNYLTENSVLFQFIKKNYVMITASYIDYVDKNNYEKTITNESNTSSFESEKILLKKLFNNIKNEAEKCKSEIIFIDIALFSKKNTSVARNYIIDNFNNLFEKNKNVNFISLYEQMSEYRLNKTIYDLEEGHPNEKGNYLIYKSLSKSINKYLKN